MSYCQTINNDDGIEARQIGLHCIACLPWLFGSWHRHTKFLPREVVVGDRDSHQHEQQGAEQHKISIAKPPLQSLAKKF